MKVGIVSRYPQDENNPRGGVESATVNLVTAIDKYSDSEVHVISLEHEILEPVVEKVGNIQVHRLPRSHVWPMIADVWMGPSRNRLEAYLKELGPDVVHFQETWGFSAPSYPFPTVFTVHGFDSLNLPAEKPIGWLLRSQFWKQAERAALKKQRYLVSIAPYVRDMLEPYIGSQTEIVDIWNSLSQRIFELPEEASPRNSVLFLGWLNSRKNPITLVEAFAQVCAEFPEVSLELAGEAADPEYHQLLMASIETLNLSDKVKLPGRLTQEDVRSALSRAKFLVLPSLQENAPMVIAEAMAAGVPVIATNTCGIPQMIHHRHTGLLLEDSHDATELAGLMRELLGDEEKLADFSQASIARAVDLFHPRSVAEKTVALYEKAIASYR